MWLYGGQSFNLEFKTRVKKDATLINCDAVKSITKQQGHGTDSDRENVNYEPETVKKWPEGNECYVNEAV